MSLQPFLLPGCNPFLFGFPARHRLRDQVPGNKRQVQYQRGGGESWSRSAVSSVSPAHTRRLISVPFPSQGFYTLARDIMARLNRKMVSWADWGLRRRRSDSSSWLQICKWLYQLNMQGMNVPLKLKTELVTVSRRLLIAIISPAVFL